MVTAHPYITYTTLHTNYFLSQPPPASNNTVAGVKRAAGSETEADSAKKIKETDEELSEAEKTFDGQFKQWEEKFNSWKLQNANHPDKVSFSFLLYATQDIDCEIRPKFKSTK